MRLQSLSYECFRNLSLSTLVPSRRITVVLGSNGQGKTNLLEGVYFLSTLKPLRAKRFVELVQFGATSAKVCGRFVLHGASREICVEIAPEGRAAFVDGKRTASLDAYFGGVSVVAFTPDELWLVRGGPDRRRAFVDRSVFNRFPAYLSESQDYMRALKNRNQLLRDAAPVVQVRVWDAVLSKLGARLWKRRRELVLEVAPRARDAFQHISQTSQSVSCAYMPNHFQSANFERADELQLQEAFMCMLDERLKHDMQRGFTSVGPHADDLELTLGAHAAKQYASQGQARAIILAWKVAEIENLQAQNGFLPLLLLDDVSSELDPQRNAFLMRYLAERGAQTFLSTTDAQLVQDAVGDDTVWYEVDDGRLTLLET